MIKTLPGDMGSIPLSKIPRAVGAARAAATTAEPCALVPRNSHSTTKPQCSGNPCSATREAAGNEKHCGQSGPAHQLQESRTETKTQHSPKQRNGNIKLLKRKALT